MSNPPQGVESFPLSWPDACRFDEEPSDAEPSLGSTNSTIFREDILRYQERKTGSTETYLTREQEYELASVIQDGKAAEELLRGVDDAVEKDALQEIIGRGQEARETLFAANARFACFAARASMNIVGFSKNGSRRGDRDAGVDDAGDRGSRRKVGSYADIRKLAQDSAELADREQIALEQMWKATVTFKPKLNEDGEPSASFATHALYRIQAGIDKYAQEAEDGGWSLTCSSLEPIKKAATALNEIKHTKESVKLGMGRYVMGVGGLTRRRIDYSDPRAVLAGRKTGGYPVALGYIPEEEDVYRGQVPLEFADLVPTSDGVEDKMFREQFEKALNDTLDTLGDREADIIRRRFGLYDGSAWTLDRIAKEYGVTRQYIHQIEYDAVSKLRHPSRSDNLRPFLGIGSSETDYATTGSLLGATNDTFPNIKTHRVETPSVPEDHSLVLESWQTRPSDTGHLIMKMIAKPPYRRQSRT